MNPAMLTAPGTEGSPRAHPLAEGGGNPENDRGCRTLLLDEPLFLNSGTLLGPLTIAYETWGTPAQDGSNAILLLHGFSGDCHAASTQANPQPGWWEELIGPGRAIDTERFFVVCPNVLGGCHGSTGPASDAPDGRPYGSRFPDLTIRDMVAAEVRLANHLGVGRWHAVVGGSMGGMRALEWAVGYPHRLERLVVLATAAACSAENIAYHTAQIRAIRLDPAFQGGDCYGEPGTGPTRGLSLARAIARLTYGAERELARTCGLAAGEEEVDRFLAEEGDALCRRFDANSYITLTRAMSRHDLGRGRGGIPAALARITARTRIVSVNSDRLFPPHRQRELSGGITSGVTTSTLESDRGHDGYLSEQGQLVAILRQSLG